jgi:hypothetical protein
MKKIQIVLDGVTYSVEVPEALADNLVASLTTLQARADSVDGLEGERDAAVKATADVQTKLDAATDPTAIRTVVAERAKLVEDCKRIAPEFKIDDAATDAELRIGALVASGTDAKVLADKNDGYVDGMFVGAVSAAPDPDGDVGGHPVVGIRSAGAAPTVKTDDKTDATDNTVEGTVEHTDAARDRMLKKNRSMATGKLDAARAGTFTA